MSFGGSFGSQDTTLTSVPGGFTRATGSASPTGFLVGDTIGFNWQINNWVLGLEADIQGTSQKGGDTISVVGPTATVNYDSRLRWFGTVRGRLGMAMDRFLPYVTGG